MAASSETHQLKLADEARQQKCIELLRPLDLSDDVMHHIMAQFEQEIAWASDSDENVRAKSSLGMKPAYIPELINGKENGQYLALDVGGTNFRVLLVTITNGKKTGSTVEFYDVPDALLTQPGDKLFEFFAQCTQDFMIKHLNKEKKKSDTGQPPINLGFCFSLPMDHPTARNAILLHWTKRFMCPHTEGHDVTEMLQTQLDKLNTNVYVLVNVNDTVGTLMAGSVHDKNVRVGLILGSGSNTAFLERADRVPKYVTNKVTVPDDEMVIMEIDNGAFGDKGSIDFAKSIWDRRVDGESNHPGSYTFEKLIGGAFLGEIVRHVICSLIDENLLFADVASNRNAALNAFKIPDVFPTSAISDIVRQADDDTDAVKKFLSGITSGNISATDDDLRLIKYACWLVSNRTAKFVACIQAQVLRHMDMPKTFCTAIAVTGSLFEKHPTLERETQDQIKRLVPNHECRFAVVKDGSGEGAAFCAAVADRLSLGSQRRK